MSQVMVDHFMWAAPELDAACAEFEALTGVAPVFGGCHPGFGTHNALASLGDNCYVELLSLDPNQDVEEPIAKQIGLLNAPSIFAFHIKRENLENLSSIYNAEGISCRGPFQVGRKNADGQMLQWRLLIPEASEFGRALPIFIDWMDAAHPARSAPAGCELKHFEVAHPRVAELEALYEKLGVSIPVVHATVPQAKAVLSTPKGEVTLHGDL